MMNFMQTNLSNKLNTNTRNDLFDRSLLWRDDLALVARGCDESAWNKNDEHGRGIIACLPFGSEKRSLSVPALDEKSLAAKFDSARSGKEEAPAYLSGIPTIYNLNWSTFRWESPSLLC